MSNFTLGRHIKAGWRCLLGLQCKVNCYLATSLIKTKSRLKQAENTEVGLDPI